MFAKRGIRAMSSRRGALSLLALAVGILTVFWSSGSIRAQTQPGTSEYPVISAERAWRFVQAADRNLDYLPGEVLVKFRPGVTPTGQQRALMALRSRPPVSDLQWITSDTALHRDQVESDATILAAQLREQPEVVYAEPNYLRHIGFTPSDPGFSRQWNLTAIDMPRAWDINPGGSANLIVAVVDSGVTTVNQNFAALTWTGSFIQRITVSVATNPDFASSRFISPADFITGNGPSSVVIDSNGHGSHVASTIGEDTNDNLAEAGIAYKVKIMPVKVCASYWDYQFTMSARGIPGYTSLAFNEGGCPTDAIVQGIRYAADNGAKVINLSLGGLQSSVVEQDALNYAVGKGAFIAISAGNDYETGNRAQYPAALAANIDGAMAVGAVGPSLTRAFYSNTGSYVEIAAPGGNDREGGTNGMIWQGTICQSDSDPATVIVPRFDRYCERALEGTSMAAPHVSGIAALIISQGVTNPAVVEALIKKTSRPLGTGGRNNEYGFGLVQPRAALFGFGIAK